jgi:prepilin-type N-terminal cleavage/methylation domain-containing protein
MFNNMLNHTNTNKLQGLTLVETLVATSIFVIVLVGIYSGFSSILKVMNIIRTKEIMTNCA